jgi:hypothetical protein
MSYLYQFFTKSDKMYIVREQRDGVRDMLNRAQQRSSGGSGGVPDGLQGSEGGNKVGRDWLQ